MNITPRIHLGTEVAAEGAKSVITALVAAGVDANKFKGMDAELDAFAKAGVSSEGIGDGDGQFRGIMKLLTPDTLPALLGKDGYVGKPGDTTFMIASRAFIGGNFLERVRRDTGIHYNTMVGGGSPSPGCTWATVSNPRS